MSPHDVKVSPGSLFFLIRVHVYDIPGYLFCLVLFLLIQVVFCALDHNVGTLVYYLPLLTEG